MTEYIIEMKNITKRFPGVIANDNVTIQIKKGEIYALLGENGAGKSTLMSILFGMYEPDQGEIWVRGEKVNIESPNKATRLNIGMVHQHFKLVENYTVAQNIILGIEPMKRTLGLIPHVDLKKASKEIQELSKKYGLDIDPDKKIEDINVSLQQRVEILKMLYREADILIFDEPTALLTPQEIKYLLDIIKGLRDQGKTIILITHKLEEIKQVAHRCAILKKGKLVDVLDVSQTSTKTMANLMVGREVISELEKLPANIGEVVLEVNNLTVKNQDGFDLVKDVSFKIHSGEIVAIAGVSGNGQVEIADAIVGLRDIHSGSVSLNGEEINKYSIRKRSLKGISYIPEDRQNYGLILDFTLSDNLNLKDYFKEPYIKNGVRNRIEIDERGKELIKKYDIRSGQGIKTQVRSMSGGNQQKIIVARETELQSDLMIFVQPTRGLDIGAIENIHKMIIEERNKGKAVLLISLELDEVMQLADTIAVIYSGQINKIADANTISTNELGEFMMGVAHD